MNAVAQSPSKRALGWLAVLGSIAYFASDLVEVAQGGFSTAQLWLTLAAEAAVPIIAVGFAVAAWPRLGRVGLAGALTYACAFGYFTWTVVYALTQDTADFAELSDDLGTGMTVAGAAMVVGALAFGWAAAHTGAYPRWTGVALALGVVVVAIGLEGPASLAGAGIRDLAFAGMGIAVLKRPGTPHDVGDGTRERDRSHPDNRLPR